MIAIHRIWEAVTHWLYTVVMSSAICNILASSLSLLSQKVIQGIQNNETPREYCNKLATSLSKWENVGNIRNAVTFLRTAIADLAICYKVLEEIDNGAASLFDDPTSEKRLMFYTSDAFILEKELRKIKSKEKAKQKFELATNNFRKCNEECKRIREDESVKIKSLIASTSIQMITEILGNLENLTVADGNCREVISELYKLDHIRKAVFAVQPATRAKLPGLFVRKSGSVETRGIINLIIKISQNHFNFRKKFLRMPVNIFNWPIIMDEDNLKTFHPIIGQPPLKVNAAPNITPSFCFEKNCLEINPHISAVNCNGEVFVAVKKEKSSAIGRINDGILFPFWCVKEELKETNEIQIISIYIDDNDFSEETEKHHKDCKNMIYILATYISDGELVFILFVVDIQGKLLHKAELTCLPRRKISENVSVKIIFTGNKIVIFENSRRKVYLCNKEGELEKPLNITETNGRISLVTATISDENEVMILQKPNKIHFYSINDDRFLHDQSFEVRTGVIGLTFNHFSTEAILLCKDGKNPRIHMLRYTKTGELQQDIELRDDENEFWKNARLISHRSGRVVVLDKNKLLNLQ